MPLNSSSSSEVEVASKETHSVVCCFDKAFFHCSSSAHVAAAFASNRWCSHSIEHRKKHLRFNVECLHAMNPHGYPIGSIDTNLD
ncbi:hypothetical protein DERF_002752 [Dermatophagoides farinae]|uniref:Uncharacterized protein n=1 Tax=Dermatophagoides farinae TaxID=6954 RepID=A0A922L9X8_DERFA|nr:hypothetical protein DERF_002752 [Dermatophagoides farinae]